MKFTNKFIALMLCLAAITQSAEAAGALQHPVTAVAASLLAGAYLYADARRSRHVGDDPLLARTMLKAQSFMHYNLTPKKYRLSPAIHKLHRSRSAMDQLIANPAARLETPSAIIASLWINVLGPENYVDAIAPLLRSATTLLINGSKPNVVTQATGLLLRAMFIELMGDKALESGWNAEAINHYCDELANQIPEGCLHEAIARSILNHVRTAILDDLSERRLPRSCVKETLYLNDWLDELEKNPDKDFINA